MGVELPQTSRMWVPPPVRSLNLFAGYFNTPSIILSPFLYRASFFSFPGATLFVDGNSFPLSEEVAFAAGLLCKSTRLSPRDLGPALEGEQGKGVADLMHSLLKGGYLYPADD